MPQVVIVGAGPAGASLGYLLARRGIEVTLVERRRDFAREFRGEVLMPSGVDALSQMGLQPQLEALPSHTQQSVYINLSGRTLVDMRLSTDDPQFIAVSQPALLEMLVGEASAHSSFNLIRGASAQSLIHDNGRVTGLRIRNEDREQTLPADLVIGADGRNSVVRRQIGMPVRAIDQPMDVVWCELPCPESWRGFAAFAGRGHLLIAYHKWNGSLQLGWVILKGRFGDLRGRGVEQWVAEMANHVSPDLADHLREHSQSVHKPFLLAAVSDCVERWRDPGALVIGDAAHTMSPVGGQGINLALRDAIVAANHLVPVLSESKLDSLDLDQALARIEAERLPEVRQIQNLQAQPPKVVLSRAWWGEPLRQTLGVLLSSSPIQQRAMGRVSSFLFGVTDVQLTV